MYILNEFYKNSHFGMSTPQTSIKHTLVCILSLKIWRGLNVEGTRYLVIPLCIVIF